MHRLAARDRLAVLVVLAVVAVTCLAAPAAAAAAWARPVTGRVTRAFTLGADPFAAGQHRGVDLAAVPGAPVGAPCSGRVAVAGRVGRLGRLVTVACGPWRATVMALARVDVRRGSAVRAGERVGTAGASAAHAGLHLGVRRASERFGYVDPLRLLPRGRPWPRVAPPAGRPRGGRGRAAAAPAMAAVVPAAAPSPAPASPAPASAPAVALWPVWLGGAALLLALAAARGRRGAGSPPSRGDKPPRVGGRDPAARPGATRPASARAMMPP
jgi:hypothetical protein